MPKPSEESYGSLGKPDSSLDDDFELDELAVSRKPHFLDYDNKPPAELVEQHHCWNGAGKEEEMVVGEEKKQEEDVPFGTAVCEHSFLYQRTPVAPEGTATIPIMNVSYDVTTATVTTLNILPAKKQGGVVNGTRGGGGTWPLKERPVAMSPRRQQQQEQQPQQQHHSLNRGELGEVGPKMECVYSLLSMLGSTNVLEMSCKFLELSRNEEKCSALRRSGCVPLLVHIIHNEPNEVARRNARHALVNVVRCNVDEGSARRELKVLRLIDQLIDYTDLLKEQTRENGRPEVEDTVLLEKEPPVGSGSTTAPDPERHPIQAIGTLAKISYDEEHRHAMCQFGALQTIASLIQLDHHAHGSATPDALKCVEMRRYASMVLTNLTFGQGNNKALLCSNREFMRSLVSQLSCTELVQVTASVLRNLSWRADAITKQTLVEIETVTLLMEAAMRCTVENTLKSILSALWNLSNHCAQNRAKVCEVTGALEFLIDLLTYEAPSKTWSIVENAGGILRNVSSHIAQCEQFRRVLREKQCLKLLLDQLKSPSLTVVSNACGTLGNLSSENDDDQRFLREHGAIPMLRSLIYSKHNIISNGSRLALKNLQQQQQQQSQRPPVAPATNLHETHPDAPGWNGKVDGVIVQPGKGGGGLPGLNVRKQRAMEQELGCAFYRKQTDTAQETVGEEVNTVGDGGSSPDRDPEPETPINYGLSEERLHQHSYDYQVTDIDQLTDYSLRYAENQSDSEEEDEEEKDDERGVTYRRRASGTGDPSVNVLMPEDSVKCYYTEGTPQIISSATSMSDLRAVVSGSQMKPVEAESAATTVVVVASDEGMVGVPVIKSNPIPIGRGLAVGDDMGCNTPDKPYNYCEEGTPDFSREASLSIIDLSHHPDERRADEKQQHQQRELDKHQQQQQQQQQQHTKLPTPTAVVVGDPNGSISGPVGKSVSFLNTGGADETPLMFSRTSSMGSLSSAEPACTDDKSSIVSEFSRMASGVMSPSELPDSPTQTIPHSPHPQPKRPMLAKTLPPDENGEGRTRDCGNGRVGGDDGVGAFADTVSKFNVEHTPAQFSCATSLSNLSLEEKDEIKQEVEQQQHHHGLLETRMEDTDGVPSQPPVLPNPADVLLGMMNGTTNATTTDEGHASDVDSDAGGGEDDELLASCISIGMNSVAARSVAKQQSSFQAGSLQSLRYRDGNEAGNDSDDSSNLSDSNDLLEECILSGMPKPKQQSHPLMPPGGPVVKENPFKMMRTNHTMVAPANDELNPFHIEDSPCNFSTISALSELTMASDTNATSMHDKSLESIDRELIDSLVKDGFPKKRELVVSSPSIESETDDHLLDEAIAAGITGKVQQARGNGTDGTKQPKKDTFGRHEATTSGGWMSPPQAQPTNDDSLPDDLDDSEQEEDYQLLVECIQKGMRPVGPAKGGAPLVTNYHDGEEQLSLTVGGMMQRSNHTNPTKQTSHPKNVQTTPAMSKGVGAFEVSPGVGSKQSCLPSVRSINGGRRQRAPEAKPSPAARSQTDMSDSTDTPIYFSLPSSASNTADSIIGVAPSGTITGADMRRDHERTVAGEVTMSSARTVLIGSEKDRPVGETAVGELPIDGGSCAKHKNPERMLQSVERLTQELVAQVEERHGRTEPTESGRSESVATSDSAALEFKIGEVVTNNQSSSGVGLNGYLPDNARVVDLEEGNLECEEPPSILYKLSMSYVHHDVAGPGTHDCTSLAPIEEQTDRVKPVRVPSNPGTPRIQKMQRESTITKEIDEGKSKPLRASPAKSLKKETDQTTSMKPVVESVTKVVRSRQAMTKVVIATGKANTKPSPGSPVHRPTGKTILPVHSQRASPNVTGATKKHRPEATAPRTQTIKPAAGIARQDTFVLDKPTLTVHVPKPMPKAGSTATEQPGTDIKSNSTASKIPLPKGEKISKPSSRIPPPKRTLAGKQSSKFGAQKSPPVGGVLRK